jgi:hypothetical protein
MGISLPFDCHSGLPNFLGKVDRMQAENTKVERREAGKLGG